jgi:hypothetical protein
MTLSLSVCEFLPFEVELTDWGRYLGGKLGDS